MEAIRRMNELAMAQHGLVTRQQLLREGMTTGSLERLLKSGWLTRVHPGVYQVGPIAAPRAREMAAVLASAGDGDVAVVSHRSAAILCDLQAPPNQPGPVEILRRTPGPGRRPGILVRCSRSLHADEITLCDGVPLTTIPRTLLDLAGILGQAEIERLLARAERAGVLDPAQLREIVRRHPRHRGIRNLTGLLDADSPPLMTRSEAEALLLALIRKARIRVPSTNVIVEGYEVDFLWPRERLIVEVDGYAWHKSSHSFHHDRRRDGVLTAAGYRIIRVTWRQITREPEWTLSLIIQALLGRVPA